MEPTGVNTDLCPHPVPVPIVICAGVRPANQCNFEEIIAVAAECNFEHRWPLVVKYLRHKLVVVAHLRIVTTGRGVNNRDLRFALTVQIKRRRLVTSMGSVLPQSYSSR